MPDQFQPTNTSPHINIVTRPDGSTFAMAAFRWDIDKQQAAVDLAEGTLSLAKIAERAGSSIGAIQAWRAHPEFKARVEEHRKVFTEMVMAYGLSQKATRMQALQDRHDRLLAIIEARARAYPEQYPHVPGGEHGYLYPKVTQHGTDHLIDTKTAALLGDIEKQAAIEVGEWNEGSGPAVAVQIVTPASAPDISKVHTVTIGTR